MASRNVQQTAKPILVENIATFRRQQEQTPLEVCIIPEIYQKRKTTDVGFIIVFGICVVVLLSLMVYALINSDMQRFTHGVDYCGNVCGAVNTAVEGISCSGKDMTNNPFLDGETCVEKCPGSTEKFHRCTSGTDLGFFPTTVKTLEEESVNLTILCIIGLVLSIVSLIIFRYFVKEFVWTMLILGILLMFALSGLMWYLYASIGNESASSLLIPSIAFTIISVIFALCIWALSSRIKLIIFFFEESVKTIFAMPLLLLEPILIFLALFIVLGLFVYTFILMASSGTLEENYYYNDNNTSYHYVLNGAMTFALYWSFIMLLWTIQFILASQQMIVAGAVATYYFARDKLTVVSPIYNSFYNMMRFHLGTVAFGSFVLTVVTIIKIIIRSSGRFNNGLMRLLYLCFRPIEDLLKYMTSMGYIETAIHGQPLCRSSVRAINLVVSHFLSAVVMNSIGNLVFFMIKLVVVIITVGIGLAMKLSPLTIVFGGLVALACVHSCFVVFEIAVDTVFLCYCEDHCANDGNTNPYYTPMELHTQIRKVQAITIALEKSKQKKKK